MSQTDLAKKLNTTKQTIGKYENGIVTNLPLYRIQEIANVFNVSPGYLTGWDAVTDNNQSKHRKQYKYCFTLAFDNEEEKKRFDHFILSGQPKDYDELSIEEVRLIFAWRAADSKTRRKVAIDLEDYGFSP